MVYRDSACISMRSTHNNLLLSSHKKNCNV